MEYATFRAPKIVKRDREVPLPTEAFYRTLVERQEQRNMKLEQFESDIQDRKRRELSLLQIRNEKQQHAVKQLQEEAERDQSWSSLVAALQHLSHAHGSSDAFRRAVQQDFHASLKDSRSRKEKCEQLVAAIVHGKLMPTMTEMNTIVAEFGRHALVACPAGQVTALVNALGALHNEIAGTNRASIATGLPDLLAQQNHLTKLLQQPLVQHLEVSGSEAAASVQAARERLRVIGKKVQELQKADNERAAQAKEKAVAVAAPVSKAATVVPSASQAAVADAPGGGGVIATLLPTFPYLSTDVSSATWVREIRQNAMQMQLPEVFEEQLALSQQQLRYAALQSGGGDAGNADGDGMMGGDGESAGVGKGRSVPLVRVDALLAQLESLLHAVVKGGSQAFLKVFIALIEVVLEEVQGVTAEEDVLMYTVIVCGIFRALSANMHKQSAKIFHALLLSQSAQCVPNLVVAGGGNGSTRVCLLFAALVGHAVQASGNGETGQDGIEAGKVSSPLTAAQGWQWLHRAVSQLHVLIGLHSNSSHKISAKKLSVTETSVSGACNTIRTFLRLAGSALYLRYQARFMELLQTLRATLKPVAAVADAGKLLTFVEAAVAAMYIAPAYYRSQAPFMLDAASLTRYVDSEKEAVGAAEQNKQSPFMVRVKELQIDRLRVIFNKLSVTVESQQAAVKSLLEKIIIANKESPEFLRYVLYKVAYNLSSDCQEEFFNEMDEGHPLKLARVACGLSGSIKELGGLIRAQFCSQCPLCIPKAAEAGLEGEAFLADMGFRQKPGGGWEDKTQWLARMSKLLCTYCVLMIQPEQSPLSLGDAWAWLSNIVNINTPRPGTSSGPKPPFFTATALEVMLRVTAQELLRAYGETFLALLRVVQGAILPNIAADAPRREELKTFLQVFLSSKGSNFMSLFNKPVTAAV